jgi:predicted house-cleaning noncanonical NTP pyrophosphatase (MazG superfamily)
MFFKYGVPGVIREDQGDGHKSGGKTKRVYSRILRKKLNEETNDIINDQNIDEND